MASSSSSPSVAVSGGVTRATTVASNRWPRLRIHSDGNSGGGGAGVGGGRGGGSGRMLPSVLLGQRARRSASSSLRRRDYSVDKLTDAVFHEFLRHDPHLDVRQSPLVAQSRVLGDSSVAAARPAQDGVHRHGRPGMGVRQLTVAATTDENEFERLPAANSRRTSPNCRSALLRNDTMATVSRDGT